MSTRTATIYTRIEPEVKEETEKVLDNIGISMSDAINLFCHQVIIRNGIPFELRADVPASIDATNWTRERLTMELQKGLDDIEAGRGCPAGQAFAALEEKWAAAA